MAKELTVEEKEIINKGTIRVSNLLIELRGCDTYEEVIVISTKLSSTVVNVEDGAMDSLMTKIHDYESEV